MTTERHNARAFAANPDAKQRGPNGRVLCRWCGTETEPPRRTFCGDECVEEWNVRNSASHARRRVFERDQGVCRLCRIDTRQQIRELREEFQIVRFNRRPPADRAKAFYARLHSLSIPLSRWQEADPFRGCWDMDHITPVAEGGGSCGLDNLRTLCLRCHHRQTRRLRQRQKQRKKRKRRDPLESYRLA